MLPVTNLPAGIKRSSGSRAAILTAAGLMSEGLIRVVVVSERRSQGNHAAVLAGWGSKRRLALPANICAVGTKVVVSTGSCRMVVPWYPVKQKDLVFLYWFADCTAELVALQTVISPRRSRGR